MFQDLKSKALDFHKKYETRLEVLFFIGGFAFDALMVSEVDDLFSLIQQAVYLFVIASLLHFETLYRLQKWRPRGPWGEKLWGVRNLILHFLLGTLLNIYSLFYIKSASVISSLVFLAFMVALIIGNETHFIKKAKVSFKIGLFAICLFSYISILFPLLLGYVGWTPFFLSIATTLGLFFAQMQVLKNGLGDERMPLRVSFLPSTSVLAVFTLFYVLGWIPPVPLSVREQGIYHLIEKKDGEYLLSTEKIWWKFWQSGDQDFHAEPQDKIYFYAQIYSPARFSDEVYVHWFWKDPIKGWKSADKIPLKITGGRKEGYRGYAMKSNYQPGEWRVEVQTSIGQEISRLNFQITEAAPGEPREFTVIHR